MRFEDLEVDQKKHFSSILSSSKAIASEFLKTLEDIFPHGVDLTKHPLQMFNLSRTTI